MFNRHACADTHTKARLKDSAPLFEVPVSYRKALHVQALVPAFICLSELKKVRLEPYVL